MEKFVQEGIVHIKTNSICISFSDSLQTKSKQFNQAIYIKVGLIKALFSVINLTTESMFEKLDACAS